MSPFPDFRIAHSGAGLSDPRCSPPQPWARHLSKHWLGIFGEVTKATRWLKNKLSRNSSARLVAASWRWMGVMMPSLPYRAVDHHFTVEKSGLPIACYSSPSLHLKVANFFPFSVLLKIEPRSLPIPRGGSYYWSMSPSPKYWILYMQKIAAMVPV